MNERHWDFLAPAYAREVQDSLGRDRGGVIVLRLDEFASKRRGTIADFAGSDGHYLGALSSRFKLVSALESAIHTDVRPVEWNMRDGMSQHRALREGLSGEPGVIGPLAAGVVKCGDVPTRHYLCEEAMVMLRHSGFDVLAVEKVQYAWSVEFADPPRWLRDPYPWGWLLVCQRV